MVDASSGIPSSTNANRLSQRQRTPEKTGSEKSDSTEDTDRFEPTTELAAREAGQPAVGVPVNQREDGGSGGKQERQPIESSGEATNVVNATRDAITFDVKGATVAQANLNRENVLNLVG